MVKIAVLGAGKIGTAVYKILNGPGMFSQIGESMIIDSNESNIRTMGSSNYGIIDLSNIDINTFSNYLLENRITHVINALPFFLNEKVATSASIAGCDYIDFTEDDVMADRVQEIYKDSGKNCAVKCGLAPGFINYIGHNLVSQLDTADSLTISVGALPRTVSYNTVHPEHSYNLTWSVDGLVNEYIRPCRVKMAGNECEVSPLADQATVVLDGLMYEAAYTSGGVGSLVRDLKDVPNIFYKTLRYPGHYDWVRKVVRDNDYDFNKIKKIFLDTFPTTDDDVIVVYAEAIGKINGQLSRKAYFNKFYGVDNLSGIQATTAGSGVAMLELMLSNKAVGLINHTDISIIDFFSTSAFKKYYKTQKFT